MSCVAPIDAWLTDEGISFKPPKGNLISGDPLKLPCRKCISCKMSRAREWAVRCMHEKQMNMETMFITLTYNDEHLPKNEGLNHEHFQLFMKRYRKQIYPKKIKFYMCGEYGENFGRPHYHALIFGHRFNDLEIFNHRDKLYTSNKLEKLWGKGFCTIGNVTFESAAYVARYIMKKISGDQADLHYKKCDPYTGELLDIEPEYNRMSNRPAIGASWFDEYGSDIHDGTLHLDGKGIPIPTYYLRLLKRENPKTYEKLMIERRKKAKENQSSEYALQARKLRLEKTQHQRNKIK